MHYFRTIIHSLIFILVMNIEHSAKIFWRPLWTPGFRLVETTMSLTFLSKKTSKNSLIYHDQKPQLHSKSCYLEFYHHLSFLPVLLHAIKFWYCQAKCLFLLKIVSLNKNKTLSHSWDLRLSDCLIFTCGTKVLKHRLKNASSSPPPPGILNFFWTHFWT